MDTDHDLASRAESFDRLAEAYDRARPGYPAALFDSLIELCGLDGASRLLELGAGTGKATVSLAERGFEILALEPGANLLEVLRRRVARFERVRCVHATFEAWELEPTSFDLVFVGQAYHWLAPETRAARVAACLRPGGALAVFGNVAGLAASPVTDAIRAAYRTHFGATRDEPRLAYLSDDSPLLAELRASPAFSDVRALSFHWTARYTTEQYVALLRTYSNHALLPEQTREALLAEVARAIDASGGSLEVEYTTGLFLAKTGA